MAQSVAQPIVCQNYKFDCFCEKVSQQQRASCAIFKKLPKVNNHPIGGKIGQSGHPGSNEEQNLRAQWTEYL
jgi:hypothetical protein